MKRFIWPLIHTYELRSGIIAGQWGWGSPASAPASVDGAAHGGHRAMQVEVPSDFSAGARLARSAVFDAAKARCDFTSESLASPDLSCALNYLTSLAILRDDSWERFNAKIDSKVLSSWVEEGISRSNCHFFGLWPTRYIHHEILNGAKGPEFASWDSVPMRQIVRVSFIDKSDDTFEVWEFSRQVILCAEECAGDWTVCNINDIVMK